MTTICVTPSASNEGYNCMQKIADLTGAKVYADTLPSRTKSIGKVEATCSGYETQEFMMSQNDGAFEPSEAQEVCPQDKGVSCGKTPWKTWLAKPGENNKYENCPNMNDATFVYDPSTSDKPKNPTPVDCEPCDRNTNWTWCNRDPIC